MLFRNTKTQYTLNIIAIIGWLEFVFIVFFTYDYWLFHYVDAAYTVVWSWFFVFLINLILAVVMFFVFLLENTFTWKQWTHPFFKTKTFYILRFLGILFWLYPFIQAKIEHIDFVEFIWSIFH
ncbi:hypothetical protein IJ732_04770 [bacterium]|nr:hypothetical protein [bacterium]